MIKILRAVAAAMLLATGAHGATVDGPFDANTLLRTTDLVNGRNYTFILRTGPLPALPDGYPTGDNAYSEVFMTITGQGITRTKSSLGIGKAENVPYRFNWLSVADGPTSFTFQWELRRYKNAIPSYLTTGDQTVVGGLNFTGGTPIFATPPSEGQVVLRTAALQEQPTAVPIGGTLPLMLSALGIGALVMRHRAKQAAVA